MDKDFFSKLIDSVICAESAGDPLAVSHKGAQGLMQLMPSTAKEVMEELGMDSSTYDPFDSELNKKLGSAYLKKMIGLFGDTKLALAAYNAGPGTVSKLTIKHGDKYEEIKEHLPEETRKYVDKIALDLMNKGVFV